MLGVDNENINILNILFVTQTFDSDEQNCICPTDYTMVLVQNSSAKIDLSHKLSSNIFQRIVFGTINSSTIADMKHSHDSPLTRNNQLMEDLFVTKSLNLNRSTFRIFFQLEPPNSMISLIDNKFIFYGPDAQIAQEISHMLNATVIIQTNAGIEYPRYTSWFNASSAKFKKSLKLLKIHKRIIPPIVISDFYKNDSSNSDLYISARPIKGNNEEITEFLYPHDTECLRIVVPRIKSEQRFVVKLSRNRVVQSICLTALLMFISKIILNRSHRVQDWTQEFFSIVATLFGQTRPNVSQKLWETIWNAQLLLIVIFSTAALSAISYQTLVSVKYVSQIDTISDLIKSNLRIFVEKSKESDFKAWGSNLDPTQSSRFIYQTEMINFIEKNKTTNVAFVWDHRTAWLHVATSEYVAPDNELSEMRMATEPLYCGFSSSRVISGSPFKHSINRLVHQMFENGIRKRQMDWSIQYLSALGRKIAVNSGNSFHQLTLSRNYGIFALYVGGVLISCIVFVMEILWKWFTLRIRSS